MKSALTLIALCVHVICRGQLTLDKPYYPRVIIPDDIYATVTVQSIVIDTLIMDNKSTLKFEPSWVRMRVNHAFIGKKVTWKGSGDAGMGYGSSGTNGKTLLLEVIFERLGRLTIDTRGGPGTAGLPGRIGSIGGPGGNGQNGGQGGKGGDVDLHYQCKGFTPVFGSGKKNAIIVRQKGGSGGTGGMGGSTRSTMDPGGRSGYSGDKGDDGELKLLNEPLGPWQSVQTPSFHAPGARSYAKSSMHDSPYGIVIEMLSGVASTLQRPNRTLNLHKALEDLNNSLHLDLKLQARRLESVSVTLPNKETFLLLETDADIDGISSLCEYLKPVVTHKLDSIGLEYEYPVYIADFFLTAIENNSSLVSNKGLREEQRRQEVGFHYTRSAGRGYHVDRISEMSHAFTSGLRTGDQIITLRNMPAAYLGGGIFSKLIDLDSGVYAPLTVERNGQTIDLRLLGGGLRKQNQLAIEKLPGNILYLHPGVLQYRSTREIRTFLKQEETVDGILLDLRDCPGGNLSDVVDLAGFFLDKTDTVAKIVFNENLQSQEIYLGSDKPMRPKSIVVLTNGNTGSGAEVLVAALRYNHVAVSVGAPTYSIGRIMMQLPINGGRYIAAFKCGELFGPDGRPISAGPQVPDIPVAEGEDARAVALMQIIK